MSELESLFMDLVRKTPVEKRDERLDYIIDDFIDNDDPLLLVVGMDLIHQESENFGCSPYQVMRDVIRHHLEQHWLREQEYWYVMREKDGSKQVTYIDALFTGEEKLAGPFDTEQDAEEALESLEEQS